MIGLDFSEPAALDAFMPEIGKAFTSAVMASPPFKVRVMLITLMGEVTAPEFRDRWVVLVAADPVMKIFMARVTKTDVIRGTTKGELLDQASLLF